MNKQHDLPFSRLTKLNKELCFWSCHKSKLLCSRRYDHMCRVPWYHSSHQQCTCVNISDHYNFLENVMELSSLLTWERNNIWSHSYSADKRQNKLKKAYYSALDISNRRKLITHTQVGKCKIWTIIKIAFLTQKSQGVFFIQQGAV